MTTEWDFVYLVPHARFKKPIERGPLALVPPGDLRLSTMASASPAVAKLIHGFTDQFGDKVEPSAILIQSDAPKTVDFFAIASFRNAIAISAVIDAWVFQLSGGNAGYPVWADYFDLYPFTATTDGKLMSQSVASMEINRPDRFNGQRAPHLPSNRRIPLALMNKCLALVLSNGIEDSCRIEGSGKRASYFAPSK